MLRIKAEAEKGHKDRMLPISPEFAEFLLAMPEAERRGLVFNPLQPHNRKARASEWWVSRTASRIGKEAKVKVNTDAKGKIKYASAHDLRRSFGERWAARIMPQTLMELMRHECIETTMKYYVGRNAQSTAAILWEAHGKMSGTPPNDTKRKAPADER